MSANIFTGKLCTYYSHYNKPGKLVPMLDVLTKQGYTNYKLLNEARLAGYGTDAYKQLKENLSTAAFSSIQDDLNRRGQDNHLYHSGFIQFDIDAHDEPTLLESGGKDELRDYIIDKLPFIAYCGSSVSNIGLWGLIPIENRSKHESHYAAMIEAFKSINITLDTKTRNVAALRFLAYDPDAHFELEPEIFTDVSENSNPAFIQEYTRRDVSDELFKAAFVWVGLKHGYKWDKGYIHNYLLSLYSTLRYANVSREQILNWIYNNLIDEKDVTTNCLDEIEIKRIK